MPDVRLGDTLIHTAPDGATVQRLAGQAAVALVSGAGVLPYYVFADGRTQPVNPPPVDGDPMPGLAGRGLLSEYDPV